MDFKVKLQNKLKMRTTKKENKQSYWIQQLKAILRSLYSIRPLHSVSQTIKDR